jgi:hypothetical protein
MMAMLVGVFAVFAVAMIVSMVADHPAVVDAANVLAVMMGFVLVGIMLGMFTGAVT